MKIAFLTLGCKVNACETERMKTEFEKAGYRIVAFSEQADIYLVNTCTVTNIADRKSRKMLHRARRKNPDAIVVAAGCYVDSAQQRGVQEEAVDVFLTNAEKDAVVECVEAALEERKAAREAEGAGISEAAQAEEHTRAYIQVQNGCNQYCSYCIIPYVRGPLTSKSVDQVRRELLALAAQGVREVVVTGIHLSSYGMDGTDATAFVAAKGKPLLELLDAIGEVEGIERIRLGSLEPRIITGEFVRWLAKNKKICPHFHLSLQSGCDTVLGRMNRHYTTAEYLDKVKILREAYDHPAITTDIIVGFPQETEAEFEATRRFAEQVRFAQMHVFKYSRRQGTVADRMEGQISEQVKAIRSESLIRTQMQQTKQYQEYFVGTVQEVLFEEIIERESRFYLTGHTTRYLRIAVAVTDLVAAQEKCNTIAAVQITGSLDAGMLLGEMAGKSAAGSGI